MTLKELFVRIAARAGNLEVLEDPVDGNVPWARAGNLEVLEDPVDGNVPWVPSMVWHSRSNNDPLHQWVRSQILAAVKRMEGQEKVSEWPSISPAASGEQVDPAGLAASIRCFERPAAHNAKNPSAETEGLPAFNLKGIDEAHAKKPRRTQKWNSNTTRLSLPAGYPLIRACAICRRRSQCRTSAKP